MFNAPCFYCRMEFPKKLKKLLTETRDILGNPDAADKDLRSFIYQEMFNFLAVSLSFDCSFIFRRKHSILIHFNFALWSYS